jgi:hypothetical protein
MFQGRTEHALLKGGGKTPGAGKAGGIGNRASSGHYTVNSTFGVVSKVAEKEIYRE